MTAGYNDYGWEEDGECGGNHLMVHGQRLMVQVNVVIET